MSLTQFRALLRLPDIFECSHIAHAISLVYWLSPHRTRFGSHKLPQYHNYGFDNIAEIRLNHRCNDHEAPSQKRTEISHHEL